MTSLALTLLRHIREMGVENMWEDRKCPNCVSMLHSLLLAHTENYPLGTYVGRSGRRGSCDVVFDANWIEVKFAWTYRDIRPYCQPNPAYRKHLLTDTHESALKDVRDKLPSLIGQPTIKRIGFLLVCFHSLARPLCEQDIHELEADGGLRDGHWSRSEFPDWPNPRNEGCLIRTYFWERSAIPDEKNPIRSSPEKAARIIHRGDRKERRDEIMN